MKLKSVKILLFGFFLMVAIGFMNTSVYAETMTPDKIQGPAYVIGSHVFTRDVNETTGYEGRLTTNLIMLASQTIESSDLDSMIIYYKTASGMWINGLTGSAIEPPTSFNINYTNLQLEEVNSTVSAPKTPILSLATGGPLSIDDETGMMTYQLDIYIDDIEDKTNKVDGVELGILDNQTSTSKELRYGEDFSVFTISDSYTGDDVEIGKQYHRSFVTFENEAEGYLNITAKAYVLDANGKKTYSDSVFVSLAPDTVPEGYEIINKYENSNQDYVAFDGEYYTYRLGITKPKGYAFEVIPEKFGYYVTTNNPSTVINTDFGLEEDFTIKVPKDSVVKCYASLGYYDKNGDWNRLGLQTSEITIDTRTLTTPVLSTFSDTVHGEYLYINDKFYKAQGKETLDYQIKGTEIYRVYFSSSESGSRYELISNCSGTLHVFPPEGTATYAARVYATNAEGETIYSDFSDIITVVRRPEIEVSEVIDGNVTVKVANLDEYGSLGYVRYKVYKWESSNGGEILIKEAKAIDDVLTIPVTSNMKIYIRAYNLVGIAETYSDESEMIDIIVE